jgi:hypothetical protein
MNEAEAYELFSLIAEHQEQLFYGYFSLIAAFLAMTYFVADKLDNALAVIVIILYSICCLWFFNGLYAWSTDLTALYSYMLMKKSEGIYELFWFGNNPDWVPVVNSALHLILTFGGWLVSVGYFFYRRTERTTN